MLWHPSILTLGGFFLFAQIAEAMDCPASFSDERASFLSRLGDLNYVVIMRHADKGGDGRLTETGEKQALAINGAFGEGLIPSGERRIPSRPVIANEAVRTCTTARLAFGVGDEVCREIRWSTSLEELALGEERGTIIVTHSEHIRAWFGWSLACGEAAIIERDENGGASCLSRVLPNEWLGDPFTDDLAWQHCSCAQDAFDEHQIETNAECSIR